MKAWLKGGLIMAGTYLAISVISLIGALMSSGESQLGWIFALMSVYPIGLIYRLLFGLSVSTTLPFMITLILVNSIIYFVLGAIIGWIVGKIRNRGKK
jgi:predicted neutral ceramidase superfamily lipid hydrolase